MKDKFIRTAPPAMHILAVVFDIFVIGFLAISVYGMIREASFFTVGFFVIEIIIAVIAALMTKEIIKNGVKLTESRVEFNWLDEENVFSFDEIERIESYKDTKPSFKKSVTDRYSSLIIHLKNGEIVTVEFGMTTKKKLIKVEKEINERIIRNSESGIRN